MFKILRQPSVIDVERPKSAVRYVTNPFDITLPLSDAIAREAGDNSWSLFTHPPEQQPVEKANPGRVPLVAEEALSKQGVQPVAEAVNGDKVPSMTLDGVSGVVGAERPKSAVRDVTNPFDLALPLSDAIAREAREAGDNSWSLFTRPPEQQPVEKANPVRVPLVAEEAPSEQGVQPVADAVSSVGLDYRAALKSSAVQDPAPRDKAASPAVSEDVNAAVVQRAEGSAKAASGKRGEGREKKKRRPASASRMASRFSDKGKAVAKAAVTRQPSVKAESGALKPAGFDPSAKEFAVLGGSFSVLEVEDLPPEGPSSTPDDVKRGVKEGRNADTAVNAGETSRATLFRKKGGKGVKSVGAPAVVSALPEAIGPSGSDVGSQHELPGGSKFGKESMDLLTDKVLYEIYHKGGMSAKIDDFSLDDLNGFVDGIRVGLNKSVDRKTGIVRFNGGKDEIAVSNVDSEFLNNHEFEKNNGSWRISLSNKSDDSYVGFYDSLVGDKMRSEDRYSSEDDISSKGKEKSSSEDEISSEGEEKSSGSSLAEILERTVNFFSRISGIWDPYDVNVMMERIGFKKTVDLNNPSLENVENSDTIRQVKGSCGGKLVKKYMEFLPVLVNSIASDLKFMISSYVILSDRAREVTLSPVMEDIKRVRKMMEDIYSVENEGSWVGVEQLVGRVKCPRIYKESDLRKEADSLKLTYVKIHLKLNTLSSLGGGKDGLLAYFLPGGDKQNGYKEVLQEMEKSLEKKRLICPPVEQLLDPERLPKEPKKQRDLSFAEYYKAGISESRGSGRRR